MRSRASDHTEDSRPSRKPSPSRFKSGGTRTSQRSHAKTGSVHHLARRSNAGSNKPNPAFDPGDIRVNASTFMKLCRTLSANQEKTSSWNRRNSSVATLLRII
jgi:hypothetical protein